MTAIYPRTSEDVAAELSSDLAWDQISDPNIRPADIGYQACHDLVDQSPLSPTSQPPRQHSRTWADELAEQKSDIAWQLYPLQAY